MKRVLFGFILGVAVAAGGGIVWSHLNHSNQPDTEAVSFDSARPINDVPPQTFYEQYQANPEAYDFIDVRGAAAFNSVHADGSRNLPLHQLYTEKDFLPREDKTIVLICSGGAASGVGYHYLEHHGFDNIIRIEDGIEAWVEAGLPSTYAQQTVLEG